MKTTEELKESFHELQEKEQTYNRLEEATDYDKGKAPPKLQQAAENLSQHFEKLYTDIRDNSESDNPVHDEYNADRPFVLKKNEIRYHDGSSVFSVIKPEV